MRSIGDETEARKLIGTHVQLIAMKGAAGDVMGDLALMRAQVVKALPPDKFCPDSWTFSLLVETGPSFGRLLNVVHPKWFNPEPVPAVPYIDF